MTVTLSFIKARLILGDKNTKIAILISGRGSNMIALAKAIAAPDFPAEVVGVLADKKDAAGLTVAADMNIATASFERSDFASKAEHEAAIHDQLTQWNAEIICLAGFMRLLSASFIDKWTDRIINIHPSLLPKYKGLNTHQRAIEAGDSEHGCTVHYVTAGMDEGPVIAQAKVPILSDDTEASLTARVLEQEHQLYAKALRDVVERQKP